MKKIAIYLMSLTLLLSFAGFQSSSKSAFANTESTVAVQGEIVNLRQGPGLTYEVLKTLSQGDTLTVITREGDWLKVKDGRTEGWVASWLVSSGQAKASASGDYIVSQVDHLNIRQQPSVSSAVIGQLFTGNEANLLKQDGDWVQIKHGNTVGWVSKTYVTLADNTGASKPSNASAQQAQYFTITVDAVNVRAKGSLNAKQLGIAYRGAKYKVLSTTDNWVQIQYENNVKAWIYSFYGSLNGQASTGKETNSKDTVTVIYNGTNLRQEASTASAVVERVDAGQTLSVIAREGDFYKIALSNGQSAYVANWVVSTNGHTGQAQQTSENAKPKTNRKAGTLQGVTLVIDAGHGGNDHGTTGVRGTHEKDITLLTAEKLTSKLRAAGATVYLTRESDTYIDLRKRVAVSHQVAADAFISLHYDANENTAINGFTTYYTNGYQKELAKYVHDGLGQKLAISDRGVQYGNYLVLRENRQKSILIELGFLSNASEERTITTDYYREQATQGMYEGILNYFNAQLK